MSCRYKIIYSARTADDERIHGEIQIQAEKALETKGELQEVARTIRAEHSEIEEVVINRVTHVI